MNIAKRKAVQGKLKLKKIEKRGRIEVETLHAKIKCSIRVRH